MWPGHVTKIYLSCTYLVFGINVSELKFLVENKESLICQDGEGMHQATQSIVFWLTILDHARHQLGTWPGELNKITLRELVELILVNVQNLRHILQEKKIISCTSTTTDNSILVWYIFTSSLKKFSNELLLFVLLQKKVAWNTPYPVNPTPLTSRCVCKSGA